METRQKQIIITLYILTEHAYRKSERRLQVLQDALGYYPHVVLPGDLVVARGVQNVDCFLSGGVQQHDTGLRIHQLYQFRRVCYQHSFQNGEPEQTISKLAQFPLNTLENAHQ
jgi:hypothetical protein